MNENERGNFITAVVAPFPRLILANLCESNMVGVRRPGFNFK
jgi:hypothetical protein